MKIYGLVGKNLDHSWSKAYFEDKFRKEGIRECRYENFPLDDPGDIMELVREKSDLAGLNITVPYKVGIIKHLDKLDPEASVIGSVNCVKITRQSHQILLEGFNTDHSAFRASLLPLLKPGITKALVLGTGGASRAVCHALRATGIAPSLVSRGKNEGGYSYDEITGEIMNEYLLIINATPAGMPGVADPCPPLPYGAIGPGHVLYDLIYNPSETLFLRKGREARATIKNGHDMLNLQAELSWAIWSADGK